MLVQLDLLINLCGTSGFSNKLYMVQLVYHTDVLENPVVPHRFIFPARGLCMACRQQLLTNNKNQQEAKLALLSFSRGFRGWGASCEVLSRISGDRAHHVRFSSGFTLYHTNLLENPIVPHKSIRKPSCATQSY